MHMPPQLPHPEPLMTAAECAKRIGLTVRALRLYEARGLLTPQRTEKNWRLYGARELARLSEILVLKSTGLSLGQIGQLLSDRDSDLDALLALQQDRLAEQHQKTERSLALVSSLRAKTGRGEVLSVDDLIHLAKETQMTDSDTDSVAWKRYEQMRPRNQVDTDPATFSDYAGAYLFEDGLAAEVSLEDGHLYLRVIGQPRVEMFPEGEDAFFLQVVPAQVSFQRRRGAVETLVLHQGGFDLPAKRAAPESFAEAEAALKERAARKEALPGGEDLLSRVIAEHRAGKPDYAGMRPPLAQLVREQLPVVITELERLGDLEELTFKHVGTDGFDVYQADFENGSMEWGFSLTDTGDLNGLYMRPA